MGSGGMSLAAHQGREVGPNAKVYQCVVGATPYRWPQQQQHRTHHHQQQLESTKTNVSPLFSYRQHNSESSLEPSKSSGVTTASSPVSNSLPRYGECGPVSTYVLPSLAAYPGSERVALIGEKLEHGDSLSSGSSSGNGQRYLRNGGGHKVHPHDHEDDDLDWCDQRESKPPRGRGLSKALSRDSLEVPPTVSPPSARQDCVGPALSSSSSSIGAGEDSFSSDGSEDNAGDGEIQSSLRRAPLSGLASLEDALPIKRGLSRYFTGQSKSFGCLSDALSTSLAKPANPYARRRKNFVLLSEERQRTFPPVSRKSASGISKKNSFGNRSNLALAMAMEVAHQEEDENDNDDHDSF